jgi:hypothetical protein
LSDAALPYAPPFRPHLAAVGIIGSLLVAVGVFLSGFVISEPAPYEVFMAGLIGLWAIIGLRISRGIAPLLVLIVLFNVGGMLSLTVLDDFSVGPMYIAVSLFLALSSVFFAAIIEAKPPSSPRFSASSATFTPFRVQKPSRSTTAPRAPSRIRTFSARFSSPPRST